MHTTHLAHTSSLDPTQPAHLAAHSPAHTLQGAWTPPATVDSEALLRGQKAVDITHNGTVYRLQATRLGKLILTK